MTKELEAYYVQYYELSCSTYKLASGQHSKVSLPLTSSMRDLLITLRTLEGGNLALHRRKVTYSACYINQDKSVIAYCGRLFPKFIAVLTFLTMSFELQGFSPSGEFNCWPAAQYIAACPQV